MHKPILFQNKELSLSKSVINQDYKSKTVLTDSVWEYVELWLRRCKGNESKQALLFWNQAKFFYLASLQLPLNARPLTVYYCFLNASKALLFNNGVRLDALSKHGISSNRTSSNNLKDFIALFKGKGVLFELSKYFQDDLNRNSLSIDEILYNLPYIHRSYIHTYSKSMELFVPISYPLFVRKPDNSDAWIQFEIKGRFRNKNALRSLPSIFELDIANEPFVYRSKKRFKWNIHETVDIRFEKLKKYQSKYRRYFSYIVGDDLLWYVKKSFMQNSKCIDRSDVTLTFAAMHWLSELVRYQPEVFDKLMTTKQNWLIREFIEMSLDQFIYSIASEITGQSIMKTRIRS